ncbi:hypothetical protein [Nonomuraea sediminis]|uniref:hypothetical protein n=1 Tax=Nonomuraea sediminis TaxID=2835864 RepID=UPI001BDCB48F|nr:hypothetical protein [Nonomuraea sediminis]
MADSNDLEAKLNQLIGQQGASSGTGLQFKPGKLAESGKKIDGTVGVVDGFIKRSGGISTGWLGCGLTGRSIDNGHEKTLEQNGKTLEVAKQALDSWKVALKAGDAAYQAADDNSGGKKGGDLGGGPGNIGDFGGLGNGKGIVPGDYKTPDFKDPKLNNPDLKNPDLNNPDLKNPDLKNPDLNNPDLKNPDLNNPDLKNPDLKNPDLKNPDLKNPNLSGLDPSKTGMDGLNIKDPTKTGLSDFDPSSIKTSQTPTTKMPDLTASPGSPAGLLSGDGVGSGSSLSGAGKLGSGMGGMPFMPLGGMGQGGNEDKPGNGSDLLRADESDFMGDDMTTDAVLRHEGA